MPKGNPNPKKWEKGESGNPNGRPRNGLSIAQLVRNIGEEVDPQEEMTRLEKVVRQLYAEAVKGNARATEILLDRGWGKPLETVAFADMNDSLQDEELEKLIPLEVLQDYVYRIRGITKKTPADGIIPSKEIIL